ncbi:S-layer homology domain-containing protein [Neobacillus sp. D3-1R]|uniref:S-layer homology domain-containing protein n=1 Tax=Neobacillus sp. D3-1R TaxID=3445778 RepID=UPI003FA04220
MHFRFGKYSAIAVVFVLLISLFTSQANADSVSIEFSDVPKDKPYASAVYELAERNIIGGYKDGTFKPGAFITRGQAAAIITKLLNLDTKNVKDPEFKDVSPKLWSYKAIAVVAEKGIFRGYGDGRFGPNDKITRAQMASILIKAFGFHYYSYSYGVTPFKDIEKLASHQDSVYTLYKLGITSGTSPTTFSPNNPITRAQAAVLITKTEKVRAATVTLKAGDFGWYMFRGYKDYHQDYLDPEKIEDEIVQVIPNKISSRVLQIVPMKEGKQKFTLSGQRDKTTNFDDFEHKKYYVQVSKENGQLKINFEETDEVVPTNVSLRVLKVPIEKISLATMDGTPVDENIEFQTKEYVDQNQVSLILTSPGEYIATVEYTNGTKARYGIEAILNPSDFYLYTYSIEDRPTVTIDLSKDKGDFSEYTISDEDTNIAKVTREENSNIFQIEGLSSGNTYIDFPKSDRKKEGTLGLNIRVQKVGSIIHVEVSRYTYYDQFS